MLKYLKYGLLLSCVLIFLGIIAIIIFLNSFNLFDEPEKEIITSACDHKGIRQATVFTYAGNATANPSIHVLTKLGCEGYSDGVKTETIFTADKPFINGDELVIKWTSFDTLTITYDAHLRIFKKKKLVTFQDSTLNFLVKYKKAQ